MPGSTLHRKQIRDNVKALLLGNTDAGNSVHISRVNKLFIEELPAIFIYTTTDIPAITKKIETNYNTICNLHIEIIVSQNDETEIIQDKADILSGQVQDIIDVNPFLRYPPPVPDRYVLPTPDPEGDAVTNYCQLTSLTDSKVDQIKEDVYGLVQDYAAGYYFCKKILQDFKDFERFGDNFEKDDIEIPHLTEIPPTP